ncbi:MAG: hypothetical protein NTX52_04825 [Planctomycetota bacterium]|nr:hypothetical protein [Planctomycetota bacterium]
MDFSARPHGLGRNDKRVVVGDSKPQITTFWGLRCATRGQAGTLDPSSLKLRRTSRRASRASVPARGN